MTAIGDPAEAGRFALEMVATKLDFPTSLTFAPDGRCYIAESGLPFGGAQPGGRIWEITSGGLRQPVAGGFPPPLNGLTWYKEGLIVSASGEIDRLELDGTMHVVLDGLPSGGNYHTNMAVVGADGWLYFSQGAMTNSGIVGLDAYELGWLRRLPHTHDIPGFGIVLRGVEVETPDPLAGYPNATTRTGAFAPFGCLGETRHVPAGLPCTAAVMRVRPNGSELELVAWGLRNAFGLGFVPDGRLLAIDQGADDRGSRPLGNVPDLLFEVTSGAWYGWPDFIGGDPVTETRYLPERGSPPSFIIANHHELPPPQAPLYRFQSHVAATKFAVVPNCSGDWRNMIAVALFGDERPMTAPVGPRVGRSIAILDLESGQLQPLLVEGLVRPIDLAYHPVNGDLYVLDFGHFEMLPGGRLDATAGSGTLWRARPI